MRTREQKIHRCLPRLAVHSYLIGPICQFAPSTRGARISPGADPIFRSACCAGYCQDNGAVKVLVVDAQGRNVCRQIFTENRHWPRASFSDMLEKYDRHSTASLKIYAQRCVYTYTPLTWIALSKLSNWQNIQNYLIWDLSINIIPEAWGLWKKRKWKKA